MSQTKSSVPSGGTKKYKLKLAHYRDGTTYPAETIVEVDAEEPKSKAWLRVHPGTPAVRLPSLPQPRPPDEPEEEWSESGPVKVQVPAPETGKQARPSDKSI